MATKAKDRNIFLIIYLFRHMPILHLRMCQDAGEPSWALLFYFICMCSIVVILCFVVMLFEKSKGAYCFGLSVRVCVCTKKNEDRVFKFHRWIPNQK